MPKTKPPAIDPDIEREADSLAAVWKGMSEVVIPTAVALHGLEFGIVLMQRAVAAGQRETATFIALELRAEVRKLLAKKPET